MLCFCIRGGGGPVYRGGPTYNTYVAPPVYGGYGYGGGISLFPSFVTPVFGFGGPCCAARCLLLVVPAANWQTDAGQAALTNSVLRCCTLQNVLQ